MSLASQVLSEDVRQHVIRADENRLDLAQLDGFSQIMDLHVDVSHLPGHRIVSGLYRTRVIAEHVGSPVLFVGDLVEDVSERQIIHFSL